MRTLALDIGTRKTGIAFLDSDVGVPMPLTTIRHTGIDGLVRALKPILLERNAESILIGLPFLPDGTEGKQARSVRAAGERIAALGVAITYVDERYTSPKIRSPKALRHAPPPSAYDGDAAAACALLLRL